MKKLLIYLCVLYNVSATAQMNGQLGQRSTATDMFGKWFTDVDPPDGDSSSRTAFSTAYFQRNKSSGATGLPGGIDGDVQIKNSVNFAGSLLNQTALKMTYHSDSLFFVRSVNNPNRNIGYTITDSAGNIISGMEANPATGLVPMGGLRAGYVPQLLSGGTAIMQINNDGVDIGPSPGHDGERLYVNGQVRITGLTGIGIAPTTAAALALPAATTTAASFLLTSSAGTDVASPVSGQGWWNGTRLNFRTGSATVDLLTLPIKYQHTIFTPTTGGTVNLVNGQYNIVNPAGALLALTVNLPSSPANNDVVYIKFTQNVTTVTYANGTVVDGITAPTAGGLTVLTFDSGTTSWY